MGSGDSAEPGGYEKGCNHHSCNIDEERKRGQDLQSVLNQVQVEADKGMITSLIRDKYCRIAGLLGSKGISSGKGMVRRVVVVGDRGGTDVTLSRLSPRRQKGDPIERLSPNDSLMR